MWGGNENANIMRNLSSKKCEKRSFETGKRTRKAEAQTKLTSGHNDVCYDLKCSVDVEGIV
jgi:hypothetical protein